MEIAVSDADKLGSRADFSVTARRGGISGNIVVSLSRPAAAISVVSPLALR